MNPPPALAGRTLWLTRPAAQSTALQQALEARGAQVFCLPLLDIVPVMPKREHLERLQNLDRYDLVFFVSTNAARIGLDRIHEWWPQYPVGLLNFAVGSGTAAVLEAAGLSVSYPRERMSSEAMLALPELQDIATRRALIVRGVGGREILAEGLEARGCQVDYVELYARELPRHPPDYLAHCLDAMPPDAVVLSSSEAMDNMVTLFNAVDDRWRALPLFVASERLRDHALALGFTSVRCLEGAGDGAIITGLCAAFTPEPSH